MNYQINQKLSDEKSGNYLVKVVKIGDKNRSKFCSFEYYVDVTIQITDLNNPTKKCGVVVPGFGPKPIELNTDRKLHHSMYFDFQDFNEELYAKLLRTQKSINEEGYYKKEAS
jgi:hypothetical protein